MSFLADVISPKARKYVYLAASLFSFGYAAWEAHGHDWLQTLLWIAASAAPASLAHANTNPVDPQAFTPAPPKPTQEAGDQAS